MERGIAAGGLGQAGQHSGFGQVEFLRGFAEIILGSCLHAVGAVAQINLVEIEIENVLFAEGFIDAVGENGLFNLAFVAALRGQQKTLGDLLGNGAAALNDGSGLEIFKERSYNTEKIDAAMFVKTRILSCDEGLLQLFGNALKGYDDASLFIELGDFLIVVRKDGRDDRRMVIFERSDFRQIPAQV